MLTCATILLTALAGSFLLTLVAKPLGSRLAAIDIPNPLSIHGKPTPRTGGLAILGGFLLAMTVALLLARPLERIYATTLVGILLAGLVVVCVGFLDDRGTIPTKVEVSALLFPALLLALLGIRVQFIPSTLVGGALTLFYVIGGCSAMNLIDGMDGLAGSIAVIVSFFLAVLSWSKGEAVGLILSLALMGAVLGFLPYNFRRASIFMGDSGSLFLGFILATVAILLTSDPYHFPSFTAPILVLVVPIGDTFVAIVRRVLSRREVLLGDRRHTYDLLRARGVGDTKTVLVMCGIAFVGGVAGLLVARMDALPALVVFVACFLGFFVFAWWLGAPRAA